MHGLFLQHPLLYIGVTGQDPECWEEQWPWDLPNTWCLDTRTGETYHASKKQGECERWVQTCGCPYDIRNGDHISVILNSNRTLTVSLNGLKVKNVFSDLPQIPLWLVISMWASEIRVATKGW